MAQGSQAWGTRLLRSVGPADAQKGNGVARLPSDSARSSLSTLQVNLIRELIHELILRVAANHRNLAHGSLGGKSSAAIIVTTFEFVTRLLRFGFKTIAPPSNAIASKTESLGPKTYEYATKPQS